MKNLVVLAIILVANLQSQVIWSPPVQITFGSGSDMHPSLVNSHSSIIFTFQAREEWLAFSRHTLIGSALCLMKTNPTATAWIDSVYTISEDSGYNANPTLARYSAGSSTFRLMLVWEKPSGLYYSYNPDGVWLPPRVLSSGFLNRTPHVAAFDSGFAVVWDQAGRIAFSEFRDTVWSPASYVTTPPETWNSSPQVYYVGYVAPFRPVVIWEKLKLPDTSRAIMYSLRMDSGWTAPDTIAWAGDNRNPRFFKLGFSSLISLSYGSNRSGQYQIYIAQGEFTSGSISWWYRDARLTYTAYDERQASFTLLPIVTGRVESEPFWFTAGTWRTITALNDSIAVTPAFGFFQYLTAGPGAIDNNPTISSGVWGIQGLRVWSVWESNASGDWKLYGSTADIPLGVDEATQVPAAFRLYQNFPNPFNSGTSIRFELPEYSTVSLKIYNLLGQEMAKLYSGELAAGTHTVYWNANNLPSGVYLYRLTANQRHVQRKLIIVK